MFHEKRRRNKCFLVQRSSFWKEASGQEDQIRHFITSRLLVCNYERGISGSLFLRADDLEESVRHYQGTVVACRRSRLDWK